MTGFSIYQSTSHKLTSTLPLTKEVVPNASKIIHPCFFLILWGFTVYSWFCDSFLLLFKSVKMHSKDTMQLLYKFMWSTEVFPTSTAPAMTQLKLPGKVGRQFLLFRKSQYFLPSRVLCWFEEKTIICYVRKKTHMGRNCSTDETGILWVNIRSYALFKKLNRLSNLFSCLGSRPQCMCANSGIMPPVFSWKNGKWKFF